MSKKVIVAMSGGVDSSVAATLLLQEGYEVIGMMLRLWNDTNNTNENRCCAPDALIQAKIVANKLKIPFYVIDAQEQFYKKVFKSFIDGYTQGITPNPCLICNKNIRWEFLLKQAQMIDADYVATGHYARIFQDQAGTYQLKRAIDIFKDQSYFLFLLGQYDLSKTIFPLGNLEKRHVREIAKDNGLNVYDRPDSQDLCFLGGEDYRSFLIRHSSQSIVPGDIKNPNGLTIGEHKGLSFYTIGQRKGIPVRSQIPLYVIEKHIETNTIIVGPKELLAKKQLKVVKINWINGKPERDPIIAGIKIRYKSDLHKGLITPLNDQTAEIVLESPTIGITPGQAAVFYLDDLCLGGGCIDQPINTYQ